MIEEKTNQNINYVPNHDDSLSFVLTSKNIGGVLAMKTNNSIEKGEFTEQILESTTSKSMTDDFLTLLKIEKKLKAKPTDDLVEYEITYFEAKDDKLIRSSKITLTLGQMVLFQML